MPGWGRDVQDKVEVGRRSREHPAEDDHARYRPGLPGVRRVRRRLPVEYPSEDEPQEAQPFDQAAVNTALAGILRS